VRDFFVDGEIDQTISVFKLLGVISTSNGAESVTRHVFLLLLFPAMMEILTVSNIIYIQLLDLIFIIRFCACAITFFKQLIDFLLIALGRSVFGKRVHFSELLKEAVNNGETRGCPCDINRQKQTVAENQVVCSAV